MKTVGLVCLFAIYSSAIFTHPGGFIDPIVTYYAEGGFQGPPAQAISVQDVKTLRDKEWVVLEGRLVRQVGHDLFQFVDPSGELIVGIDAGRWQGQTITPKDKIRLEGEVEKDCNSTEIEGLC